MNDELLNGPIPGAWGAQPGTRRYRHVRVAVLQESELSKIPAGSLF